MDNGAVNILGVKKKINIVTVINTTQRLVQSKIGFGVGIFALDKLLERLEIIFLRFDAVHNVDEIIHHRLAVNRIEIMILLRFGCIHHSKHNAAKVDMSRFKKNGRG